MPQFNAQDFETKVAAMKAGHVSSATFDEYGNLRSAVIDVAMANASPAPSDEPDLTPNERTKQAQRQIAERNERMRYGASGGPRPLGPDSR